MEQMQHGNGERHEANPPLDLLLVGAEAGNPSGSGDREELGAPPDRSDVPASNVNSLAWSRERDPYV
jgi:hypothetical protein